MSEPRIIIPTSVRHDHDALRELMVGAMADCPPGTEVHVKARSVRYRYEVNRNGRRITGTRRALAGRFGPENVQRLTAWGPYLCSGRAYRGLPSTARVAPGTRWLVTLTIPQPNAYALNTWPLEHVYPGKGDSRAPWPRETFRDWREDVVHTAAHECRHVQQFTEGAPTSEMDAERHACYVLAGWRSELAARFPVDDRPQEAPMG